MKINLFNKAFLLVSLLLSGNMLLNAQSVKITPNGSGTNIYCLSTDGSSAVFTVTGENLIDSNGAVGSIEYSTWNGTGGITVVSQNNQATVRSLNTNNYTKHAKGKLSVVSSVKYTLIRTLFVADRCKPEEGPVEIKDTITYHKEYSAGIEIRKSFTDLSGNEIVGPDCIKPGSKITFSVDPWVSMYQLNTNGMDNYYWDVESGLNASPLYYSADSSSITFVAGNDIKNKKISLKMGYCNVSNQTPIVFQPKAEPADPIFANGFGNGYCLPLNKTKDTIIITNPQEGITYVWDLRTWSPIHTSRLGDTIIFTPEKNSPTIKLEMSGGCESKSFVYDINRSLDSIENTIEEIDGATCFDKNVNAQFHVPGVPEGTEMLWTVKGDGWSILYGYEKIARPIIKVGTGKGTLSVQMAKCGGEWLKKEFQIKPDAPGQITGPNCFINGSQEIFTFSVAQVSNANSYEWYHPGFNVIGSVNDSIIHLQLNETAVSSIKVRAIGCSASNWSPTKNIGFAPVTPGEITVPCVNVGIAKEITVSVDKTNAVPGTTFEWFIPSGFGTFVRNNVSDGSSITIRQSGTEGTYELQVKARTSCSYADTISKKEVIVQSPISLNISGFGSLILIQVVGDLSEVESNKWYVNGDSANANVIQWGFDGVGVAGSAYILFKLKSGCEVKRGFSWNASGEISKFSAAFQTAPMMTPVKSLNNSISMKLSNDIKVYPNPASESFIIQLPEEESSNIMLISMDGKVVKSTKAESAKFEMDLSGIQSGNYVVYVVQGKNKYTKNIIVKK